MVEDEKAQDADYYSRCEKSGSVSGKVEAKSTQVDAQHIALRPRFAAIRRFTFPGM